MDVQRDGRSTARSAMLLVALAGGLVACRGGDDSAVTSAMQELRTADATLQRAVAAKDLEQIVAFYAEDAVLLPAAEPRITGKAGIRREWQHVLSIPDYQNETALSRIEVAAAADMAYSWGTYRSVMRGEDGSPVIEPGKWLSVWKKQPDGSWRIVVDTYNTDVPPPDHK